MPNLWSILRVIRRGLTSCECGNRSGVPSATQLVWRLSGCGKGS